MHSVIHTNHPGDIVHVIHIPRNQLVNLRFIQPHPRLPEYGLETISIANPDVAEIVAEHLHRRVGVPIPDRYEMELGGDVTESTRLGQPGWNVRRNGKDSVPWPQR